MNFRFARNPDYKGSVDGTDQLPDGRPLGDYFRTRLSIGRLEVQSGNQKLSHYLLSFGSSVCNGKVCGSCGRQAVACRVVGCVIVVIA